MTPTLSPGKTIGQYRIASSHGSSVWGDLYRANDTSQARDVQLLILRPDIVRSGERVKRFVDETKRAASINHPHIARIYGVGKGQADDGTEVAYLAAEIVEAQTLRHQIEARPGLEALIQPLINAGTAIVHAHAAGLLHRDLRPDNLVFTRDGVVKVTGFGVSNLLQPRMLWHGDFAELVIEDPHSDDPAMTVAYIAPEVLEGKEADARSDVFSFGCILYEAVAGQQPFAASSETQTVQSILESQPKSIREIDPAIPAELEKIIRRCLARRPEQRYQNFAELVNALLKVAQPPGDELAPLDSAGGSSFVGGSTLPVSKPALIAIAAAVVLGGGFLLFLANRNDAPDEPAPSKTAAKFNPKIEIGRMTTTGDVIEAVVSPDGSVLAYVRGEKGLRSLWTQFVASTKEAAIIEPGPDRVGGLTFARNGRYLYYITRAPGDSPGELYQIAITGGTPIHLLSKIDSPISFSPDGERFAFVRRDVAKTSLIVSNVSGRSQQTIAVRNLPSEWLSTAGPAWSPDGRYVACSAVSLKGGYRTTILAIPLERGPPITITDQLRNVGRLGWVPNGRNIVASSVGRFGGQVWLIGHPRGQVRRVVVDLDDVRGYALPIGGKSLAAVQTDWSTSIWSVPLSDPEDAEQIVDDAGQRGLSSLPDGGLVFASSSKGRGVWSTDAEGDEVDQLSEYFASDPDVSPDGRFVVFYGGEVGEWGIWRFDRVAKSVKLLLPDRGATPHHLQIADDGRSIVYTAVPLRAGASTVWKLPIDGGSPQGIFNRPAEIPAISADGSLLACRYLDEATGQERLGVFRLRDRSVLLSLDVAATSLRWLPGGTAIAYSLASDPNVWSQPLSGAPATPLTKFDSGEVLFFDIASEGGAIHCVRGQRRGDVVLLNNFQ